MRSSIGVGVVCCLVLAYWHVPPVAAWASSWYYGEIFDTPYCTGNVTSTILEPMNICLANSGNTGVLSVRSTDNGTGGVVTHKYTQDKACGGSDTINSVVYTNGLCSVSGGISVRYQYPFNSAVMYSGTFYSDSACQTIDSGPQYHIIGPDACGSYPVMRYQNEQLQSCSFSQPNCAGTPTCQVVNTSE